MRTEFDYIIVGGGSAGCVVANRLSANPQARVLLIEAGPRDWFPLLHVPGYMHQLLHSRYMAHYHTVPQEHLNNRSCLIPQGHVLGGGSTINAMIYIRGNPEDYRIWRQLGNEGWDWEDVLPYFVAMENNDRHRGALHGTEGPLHVSDIPTPNETTLAFVEACVEAGIPRNPDFNGPVQEGVGIFQNTAHRGRRWSAVRAFLDPIRGRRNLTVVTGTRTRKVLVQGGRAIGVEANDGGGALKTYHAQAEVIVSSGPIASPQLLLLSGIGPADELRAVDVKVVHDLPGVGKNFHDHIDIGTVFHCKKPVTYDHERHVLPMMKHGLRWLLNGTGPAATIGVEGCAYTCSDRSLTRPDISLHYLPIYILDFGRKVPPGHGMTLHNNNLRPKSRGEIKLASADPGDKPLVDPKYLSHPDDIGVLIHCVKWARRVMESKAMAAYYDGEMVPGKEVRTDAEIEAFVRQHAETDFHPVGGCKMGNDALAVVDNQLRVHGLQGLRVIDSSVMPNVTTGNTNAPTMMIAAKAADMIVKGSARTVPDPG